MKKPKKAASRKSQKPVKKRRRNVLALSPAKRFKARLDFIQEKYLDPRKGRVSKNDLAFLKEYRPELWPTLSTTNGSPPSPPTVILTENSAPMPAGHLPEKIQSLNGSGTISAEGSSSNIPDRFNRQSDLARFLHERFREKISITINPQAVDDWRSGIRLPEIIKDGKLVQAPPFPNKDASGTFWSGPECVKWVEDWIVPKHGHKTGANGNGNHVDLRTRREEHEIWKMDRERAIADGEYKPAAEFLAFIDRLRETFKTVVVTSIEGSLVREMQAVLDEMVLADDIRGPAKARCQAIAQKAVDDVLQTWRREVKKIGEQVEVKEHEQELLQ